MRIAILIAALAAFPTTAFAAGGGPQCNVPAQLPRPMLEGPTPDQPRRLMPITSYTLAISWSPQYCSMHMTSPKDRLQCGGALGDFGFTLHGLWPDGSGGSWPQYCKPTRLVPEGVIRNNLCDTPSVQLIQHEWEKHGTCMVGPPATFFARSASLYRALSFPDMEPFRGRQVDARSFRQAFADANPGMRADQLKLNVNKQGWLEEVWICLDTRLRRRACAVAPGSRGPASIRIR